MAKRPWRLGLEDRARAVQSHCRGNVQTRKRGSLVLVPKSATARSWLDEIFVPIRARIPTLETAIRANWPNHRGARLHRPDVPSRAARPSLHRAAAAKPFRALFSRKTRAGP